MDEPPYHEGEQAIQERFGLRAKMDGIGRRVIRDFMPDEHRDFFAQLPWLLVGSLDAARRPWASVLTGSPGFVTSPDARTLSIAADPVSGEVLAAHLKAGAPLGLLGLELHTQRRNRLNGTLTAVTRGSFELRVEQSFGNCPKYINRKYLEPRPPASPPQPPTLTKHLGDHERAIIARADTLFIASSFLPTSQAGRRYGVDVSHRGGAPGFVRVEADGSLTIPDYVGNFAFNTLGNIDKDRRAGLLFIDFESGDMLQLTGEAWIDWDAPEVQTTAGVQRLLRVQPEEIRLLPASFPYSAIHIDHAPQLAAIESIARDE